MIIIGLFAVLWVVLAVLFLQAPAGYEDEWGFHRGDRGER